MNNQERYNQAIKRISKNKKPPSLKYRIYMFKERYRNTKKWISGNPKEALVYILAIAEIIEVTLNLYKTIIT